MRRLKTWGGLCAIGTLFMVVLGGLTRLTESGLSIVEWQLFKGILPPLNRQGWVDLFDLYTQTPEFLKKNPFMDLEAFKRIFWLEYVHRLWGRTLGIFVVFPGFYFFCVSKNLKERIKVLTLMSLLLLQGVVGWLMVKSGLIHDPWVSPYRLCFHLVLALILFLGFLDVSLGSPSFQGEKSLYGLFSVLCITLCFGAFVAGLDAGLIYNTFPLMDGAWFPDRMFALDPFYRNFFENPGTAQWTHRCLAYISLGYLVIESCVSLRRHPRHRRIVYQVLFLGCLQVLLGIFVLLFQVPLFLGALHQCVAFLLIGHVWVWICQVKPYKAND